MLTIYIDADGCPVKDEVYKVALRYQLKVYIVANKQIKIPSNSNFHFIEVSGNFDAADDWISSQILYNNIVITGDILLAERCLKLKAHVLGYKGIEFTDENIGNAIATRELMQNLRYFGANHGNPRPLDKKDKSLFLRNLDQIIQAIKMKS